MKEVDTVVSNRSSNPALHQLLAPRLSRRQMVQGGLVAAGLALLGRSLPGLEPGYVEAQSTLLGFTGVPVSTADTVTVPEGYTVQVFYAWGDPIADGPAFTPDASSSAEEQPCKPACTTMGCTSFRCHWEARTLPVASWQSTMSTPMMGCST